MSAKLAPSRGQVALWWLGQSGFGLRGNGANVLVDPFLADHPDRLVSPPFRPEQVGGLDVVAITHDHLDHLDDESLPGLAEASPSATFVLPEPLVERVANLSSEEIALKHVTVHGIFGASREAWQWVASLFASGRFDPRPLVTHRFLLEQHEDAFATLRSADSGAVKVELLPAGVV